MKFDSILKYIVLGGIFLMPFVAFVVSESLFFPFITGKNIAFRILTEIIFVAWIIGAMRDKTWRPKWSWVLWSLTGFVALIGLADILGINPAKSFWSNLERMDGYITLLHVWMYVIAACTVLSTQKLWTRLLNTTTVASVGMALFALGQSGGVTYASRGITRLDGTFGNATYLAVYMLFHIFITLYLLVKHEGRLYIKWIYGVLGVLQIYILSKTATRGAMLGLFGGFIVVALLVAIFEKKRQNIRKFAAGALVFLVVVGGVLFALRDNESLREINAFRRLSNISLEDGTTQARLTIWRNISWEGVKERPILGWGQESFNVVFNKHFDPSLYNQEQWFDRSHNVVFDWLIAGGALGFLAYASIFVALLYYIWRRKSKMSVPEKSVLTGLLAAYTFHNMFVFDNIVSYILFATILSYVHVRSMNDETDEGEEGKGEEKKPTPQKKAMEFAPSAQLGIGVAAIIVFVVVMYSVHFRAIQSGQALLGGIRGGDKEQSALAYYEEALAYDRGYAQQEILSQMYSFGLAAVQSEGVDVSSKQMVVDLIQGTADDYLSRVDTSTRVEFFHANFLFNIGNFALAQEYYERALELSPNKQQIRFGLINSLLSQGMQEEALEIAKSTFELEPRYDLARRVYIMSLIQNDNIELARELLAEGLEDPKFSIAGKLVNAFVVAEDWETVLLLWQTRVERDPEDVQAHISLAAAYDALDRDEEAVREIERAAELSAEFAPQAPGIIEEIRSGKHRPALVE